jgi:hypothetical protein
LLLFRSGGSFVPAAVGEVRVDLVDDWDVPPGTGDPETAQFTIAVGARPPFFEPEEAP